MSIWHTLGIAPTSDLESIKQAYAERAKQYHPEEHPDEFRALHEAYRQAVRYAKQHAAAAFPVLPTPPPAAPTPDFKPSFQIHAETDNPARARQHLCVDDVFSAKQYDEMRKENKRVDRPAPHRKPELSALPHGKHLIRGAGAAPAPVDGLSFDAVDHPADEEPPDEDHDNAALFSVAPKSQPAPAPKPAHPFLMSGLLLGLWSVYLFTFAAILPGIVTGTLYMVLFVRLFRIIPKNTLLTIASLIVDAVSMVFLDVILTPLVSASAAEMLDNLCMLLSFALPVLRITMRAHVIRSAHSLRLK